MSSSKYDEFVRRVIDHTNKFETGYTPEADGPYCMGPVTDPRQVQVIESHLEEALAKGARVLTGGKEQGMFYYPMVMVDVDHSMRIMQEETFGPVMPIMKVKDEAEAIRLANDNRFGLGASVWGQNIAHAKQVADQIQASSVIINDSIAQFGIPMLPFGGIKDLGIRSHARTGGTDAVHPAVQLCSWQRADQVGYRNAATGERALRPGDGSSGCYLWHNPQAKMGNAIPVVP